MVRLVASCGGAAVVGIEAVGSSWMEASVTVVAAWGMASASTLDMRDGLRSGRYRSRRSAAALHVGFRFTARRPVPPRSRPHLKGIDLPRSICLHRPSWPSSARCCHACANTAGPAALRRSLRLLPRSADPSVSAPVRQPASAFPASARRAPHGPAAEDAGPSATAVAGCRPDWRVFLQFILHPSDFSLSPPPLPWPALRGAIQAPGRSKRRPSMSAVPAASCSSFSLYTPRVAASGAFSFSPRGHGRSPSGGYPRRLAGRRCAAPESRILGLPSGKPFLFSLSPTIGDPTISQTLRQYGHC